MARYNDYDGYDGYGWRPYVTQATRRAQVTRELKQMRAAGTQAAPVEIVGRKIAATFWGASWCTNLEAYSDYANRLPRGRTYVRGGAVIDLQIEGGRVAALVSGSAIYRVTIEVAPVPVARWRGICEACAGGIDSLVELLQGRFSKAVMEYLCKQGTGLFPSPRQITFSCSCPDWASMCKHVAAVLYGVGARLDHHPELLFRLRKVNEHELLAGAASGTPLKTKRPSAAKVLDVSDLAGVFGVELVPSVPPAAPPSRTPPSTAKRQLRAVPTKATPRAVAPAKTKLPGKANSPSKPGLRSKAKTAAKLRSKKARTMSAADRKAVSERVKRYWLERRKARR